MGRPSIDITNKQFGTLTALSRNGNSSSGDTLWKCQCTCGKDVNVKGADLRRGRSKFCTDCNYVTSVLSPIKCIYTNYIRQAEKRGLTFELTIEDFISLIRQPCIYCGTPPIQLYQKRQSKEGAYYNGLDRQDNKVGYVLSNVVSCCKFCNFAKKASTLEQFEQWISRLISFRTKTKEN